MVIINTTNNEIAYQTKLSAGFDICATEFYYVLPGERELISTGLFLDVWKSDEGLNEELQIRPRSSLALKGILIPNSPGTIDADYPDEIKVILWNTTDIAFSISPGDRIAQGVVCEFVRADNVFVKEVNRTGGLGSTNEARR